MMADRHALCGREMSHQRDCFLNMGVTVTVDKRQPKYADVEAFQVEQITLGGEFAHRVGSGRIADVVFTSGTAAGRAIHQAGADEDESLHGRGPCSTGEMTRSEV